MDQVIHIHQFIRRLQLAVYHPSAVIPCRKGPGLPRIPLGPVFAYPWEIRRGLIRRCAQVPVLVSHNHRQSVLMCCCRIVERYLISHFHAQLPVCPAYRTNPVYGILCFFGHSGSPRIQIPVLFPAIA